jgi:hypothetical protein
VTESDDREPVPLAPVTPGDALRVLLAVKPDDAQAGNATDDDVYDGAARSEE